MLRRTCHRRARTTVDRRRVPLLPSSCLLCTNYSSNHYMQQSTAVGEPLRTSLLLLYVIREIGFVDGFRWNFPALSSTWPRYSSEYCKTYNNLWNTSCAERTPSWCVWSRRVEVNVYVFGERMLRYGRYLDAMWQYYYSNNRTQTIHCGWTNKQMYMHYIITILRSKGKFIYILIHHIKLICIGCPFIISHRIHPLLCHFQS